MKKSQTESTLKVKQKEDSLPVLEETGSVERGPSSGGSVRQVIDGAVVTPPPIWLMRQAGRYLPEYRAIRAQARSFLDLCFDPARAVEITMQPVRRFDLDAAILFSDILVVPHALGRRVDFVEGSGPRLDPIDVSGIGRLDGRFVLERLRPVLETVAAVRGTLAPEKTMIGFAGAPWTVATYMIAGRGTPDQAPASSFAADEPDAMQRLIDALSEATIDYLVAQIRAGADVVQLFDTWAGVLSGDDFERWCLQPTAEIVQGVKANEPDARIVGFPKGIGARLERYVTHTGVDAVALDWTVPLDVAARLQAHVPVQGNLDPAVLVRGGDGLDSAVDEILAALSGGSFVFNLGHGIVPETPVDNVQRLVNRVRGRG
jgi:uroporphyrinogen decarboxylase